MRRLDRGAPSAAGPRRSKRIWSVIMTLGCLAAGMLALVAAGDFRPPGDLRLPWWVLAAVFACTEAAVLHVQIRREARSVSLSEIPLCIGLFFIPPWQLLLARIVGALAVWIFWRRQPLIKMAFNVANATAEIALALLLFYAVGSGADPNNASWWLAAMVAAVASSTLAATAVTTVIAAAENIRPGRQMLTGVVTAAPIAAMVSIFGIISVAALSWNPWMSLPLGASVLGVTLVYRAYASLSGRHLALERLYRFSEVVGSSPEVDEVLCTILLQAKELLRAEWAEILFVTRGQGGIAIRLDQAGGLVRRPFGDSVEEDPVWRSVLTDGSPVLMQRNTREPAARAHLLRRQLKEAIATPLRGAAGVVGALTVANRMGDVRTFDRQDVRLLETVANTASVAWQNSRLIDRLRHDSLHDALTGLPNRVLLHQQTTEALQTLDATGERRVAMLLLDLDGFKEVNDTLGHQYGDMLLREVATRFTQAAGERGFVARLGGDEFAVLVRDAGPGEEGVKLAHDLQRSLERPIVLEELSLEITASFGVAMAPEHATQSSGLLRRADVAMYVAKSRASGVQVYRPEMDFHSPQRLGLARELRQAIGEHEIEVYVQPQAVMATGAVTTVEALARWHHPEKGWIRPEEFVAVAERSGLIHNLTTDVLRQSLAFATDCRDWGRDIGVSVNLSARSLQDGKLTDEIEQLLGEFALPPQLLTFEITESTVMTDSDRNLELLRRLSDMGVRLSIDDFGTGYSSLSHLRRLPIQEVKIDRSFVTNMSRDPSDATIAQAIIDLGANLHLGVVAEGVEENDTWRHLTDLGCERAQGFFLSRPMPTDEFGRWLERYELATVCPTGG